MADTIMAMLIASASVEINMVSPFASFIGCFACSTPQMVIWLPRVSNYSQNLRVQLFEDQWHSRVAGQLPRKWVVPDCVKNNRFARALVIK